MCSTLVADVTEPHKLNNSTEDMDIIPSVQRMQTCSRPAVHNVRRGLTTSTPP